MWHGRRVRPADSPSDTADRLAREYFFLRRVEHLLQILEDRQVHAIPSDPAQLEALAKRALGPEATAEALLQRLAESRDFIRATRDACLA